MENQVVRPTLVGQLVDPDTASLLVAQLTAAEAELAPTRIAQLSRFEGTVTKDDDGDHPHPEGDASS